MAPSPTRPAIFLTTSIGWLTKTPTGVTKGGRLETIVRARDASMNRGLSGHNTKPSASAPARTATSASAIRVMPQIFTSIVVLPLLSRHEGRNGHKGERISYLSLRVLGVLCVAATFQ